MSSFRKAVSFTRANPSCRFSPSPRAPRYRAPRRTSACRSGRRATTGVQRALQCDRKIEAYHGLGAAEIGEELANRPDGPGLHGTPRWQLDIRPVDAKLYRDKRQQQMHTALARERAALAEYLLRLGPAH